MSLLHVTSDYTLLKSLIKIDDLITYLIDKKITSCALVDSNLFGSIEFYNKCIKNNIKPIIGLDISIDDKKIYLYAKNNKGFKKLLKLNTKKQLELIDYNDIKDDDIYVVLPYESIDIKAKLTKYYLSYKNEEEYKLIKDYDNILFINEVRCLEKSDIKYLNYLELLNNGDVLDNYEEIYKDNYIYNLDLPNKNNEFIESINITLEDHNRYIPVFDNKLNDSSKFLEGLAIKGLSKRYKDNIPSLAKERLLYELKTINDMGFVDYFLIVYDYVLYAKKHDIYVGPGRGSAAGSLVSYSLGITDVNPLEYNLLFERFLNKDRITMPDIDIDFEYTKRHLMIDYVKEKYGKTRVAPIITYGTLASKQVLRDVSKLYNLDNYLIDKFVKEIDSKLSLKDNAKNERVKKFIINNPEFKDIYKTALKFEGLKRHTSTHAAGVVICSEDLDNLIPVYYNNDDMMTGYTMEYLEDLGLLKMDFLALKNLTTIKEILDDIETNNKETINLNNINYEDQRVYKLFESGNTDGIFQFESSGMKNMLMKFKPTCFNDLIVALAIFRPGPMENIDAFIKRKNGQEKISYIHDDLKDILNETYGIIVYQEQIMQILVKMGGYTFQEADNIRRAMSKKKEEIIIKEKDHFIKSAVNNGYEENIANKVYELILKFANYGFNKAHSVSYAKIGYQMAYLKALYPLAFIKCLLNNSIGSEEKTKDYINLAKKQGLEFINVDINDSESEYKIKDGKILLPLSIVKNVGDIAIKNILQERENGLYSDFLNFVARTYSLGINKGIIESLIKSGAFKDFNNAKTLINNITVAINYADLVGDLDEEVVMKPILEEIDDYSQEELREMENESLGFFLSNHPSSKYLDCFKIKNIKDYFDKSVKMVVLVEKIKTIKTKNNEDMAFLTISDETMDIDAVVFPKQINQLDGITKGSLVDVLGKVTKRFEKYNINILSIKKVN